MEHLVLAVKNLIIWLLPDPTICTAQTVSPAGVACFVFGGCGDNNKVVVELEAVMGSLFWFVALGLPFGCCPNSPWEPKRRADKDAA